MSPIAVDTRLSARWHGILGWLARQLELSPQSPWWLWLWRLLVRPTQPDLRPIASILRHVVGAALRRLGRTSYRLWLIAWWPLRFLIRFLGRLAAHIEVQRVAQRVQQRLNPLLAQPSLRWSVLLITAIACVLIITTPFNWIGQLVFFLLCWCSAMVLRLLPGRYPSIALAAISLLAMGRYIWWRLGSTLAFDSYAEAATGIGLLLAEAYTWLVVSLGFIQLAWPLKRPVPEMQGEPATWPSVDVFIPTYNESLSVVGPTTLAALSMDWPRDKLHVFILDDGHRAEMQAFAHSVNVGYISRSDNRHAKAGNLNHALGVTHAELVAIFDCDHLPVSSFLKNTVGCLQQDPTCAMVQTPHHFFSPDPFERNLGTFRRVPNEGALFYGLIQDGNDFWNAAFFCGSCAVIRRAPLLEVGGIAVETVTEDAHTALKLQRLGYSTAYINRTLAAGLATESLSAHVGQRIRWARGMAQILRIDTPFLGPGLTLGQRICYANAMLHFFFGLPRLVFLTTPMAYLFFGMHIINAQAMMLALYVLPYIIQSNIANAHVQGVYRHTFWAEVYETVLAWYVAWPTTVALIKPKAGTFNVTAKGGLVSNPYFDWSISKPYTLLALLNLVAIGVGLVRLFYWNTFEADTVLLNLVWTFYSALMLGAAIGVASESRQVRRMHRVPTNLSATLKLNQIQTLACKCVDFSMTGLGLQLPQALPLARNQLAQVSLWRDGVEYAFPARVVLNKDTLIGVQFDVLTLQQQIDLVQCTFARPDAWSVWNDSHDADRPLLGLQEIALVGLRGYRSVLVNMKALVSNYLRNQRARRRTSP